MNSMRTQPSATDSCSVVCLCVRLCVCVGHESTAGKRNGTRDSRKLVHIIVENGEIDRLVDYNKNTFHITTQYDT